MSKTLDEYKLMFQALGITKKDILDAIQDGIQNAFELTSMAIMKAIEDGVDMALHPDNYTEIQCAITEGVRRAFAKDE